MPQYVDASIKIDGKELNPVTSFQISQSIYQHHSFRVLCPVEALDGSDSSILHSSKDIIGSSISIQTRDMNNNHNIELNFSGVITHVEGSRQAGEMGQIIIAGFSPTIIMDNGPHCRSYEKKKLKNIVADVVSRLPSNLAHADNNPVYGETLSYVVQYWETGWDFLRRLCATFGEWLFYDGEKIVIGKPASKSKTSWPVDSFSLSLQLRPLHFDAMAFDYINNQVYTSQSSTSAAGLDNWGSHVANKSTKFYGNRSPKQWNSQFLTSKSQLDAYVKARTGTQSSNMVHLTASSSHGSLRVGSVAQFEGCSAANAWEQLGDYTIISIDHFCDGHGGYSNRFTAVPASNKMPPLTEYREAHCETQSAFVTDNNDSDGLGRVRVRFHWMDNDERSPWLRISSMHGGGGKGAFFIPEVGEEVLVGFEDNNPAKPFVLGTLWNGKDKAEFSNDKNDLKVIRTRTGNRIVMNDKEGSLTVVDQKDNKMQLDGSGNINITSTESIVLTCGDSKISLKKDGTIEIDGKNITIKAEQKAKMASGQASFVADGEANEADMKGMSAKIEASNDATLKGSTTKVSATAQVEVNGGGQVNIGASGMVAVKGAAITLN